MAMTAGEVNQSDYLYEFWRTLALCVQHSGKIDMIGCAAAAGPVAKPLLDAIRVIAARPVWVHDGVTASSSEEWPGTTDVVVADPSYFNLLQLPAWKGVSLGLKDPLMVEYLQQPTLVPGAQHLPVQAGVMYRIESREGNAQCKGATDLSRSMRHTMEFDTTRRSLRSAGGPPAAPAI